MSVLYVTHRDEETGIVAAITDDPCACGWPETVLHVHLDGRVMRGCPSCEIEIEVADEDDEPDERLDDCPACDMPLSECNYRGPCCEDCPHANNLRPAAPRPQPMPYTNHDERVQREEMDRRRRWTRSDWAASLEAIVAEHELFRIEIPFSGDTRPERQR